MPLDTTISIVTMDEAKRYLKVDTDTSDEVLAMLMNGVATWVRNYLNRTLVRTTYTEYYNGDGSDLLLLRNTPIYSVTTVHVDSLRVFGADTLVASTDYITMKEAGVLRAWNYLGSWSAGTANIKAVYSSGYTTGETGTMPHDVRLAVLRILDHQWRTGYTHRKLDVSSESVGDQTTTFRDGSLPKDTLDILGAYRRPLESPQFSHAD